MEGLFRGTWYRSEVKLEGETIIPIPPFESYNPFDWYYSASDIRQGERSLYLDFLAVDSDKPEEVLNFCQRFGMLGNPVVLFHLARGKGKARAGKLGKAAKGVIDILEANILLREGSPDIINLPPEEFCFPDGVNVFQNIQEKFKKAITYFETNPIQLTQHSDLQPLALYINQTLRDSRIGPQLAWNVQKVKWELVWNSVDLTGYLYLMLMLDLLGPGTILACPRCKKYFVTASQRTKYCSSSCYEVFKVKKYQKKKKEEAVAALKKRRSKASKPTEKKK